MKNSSLISLGILGLVLFILPHIVQASGTSLSLNTWVKASPSGPPPMSLGYDKTIYVDSLGVHCIRGGYHQPIGSEPDQALACYSYTENRWFILQNSGIWQSTHNGQGGHVNGVVAYMSDYDALAFQTDGSDNQVDASYTMQFWWFDFAGLTGQNRAVSNHFWLGAGTPNGAAAYDPINHKLVMHPGNDGSYKAMSVYSPSTGTVSSQTVTGTAPANPGLDNLSMVFNPDDGLIYVYGGGSADIYTINAATNVWAKLTTTCTGADCSGAAPAARRAAGFAYSTTDHVFLMMGGVTGNICSGTARTETWKFDPVTLVWTELSPSGTYLNDNCNSLSWDRLTYDATSNVFVYVSRGGSSNYADGTWTNYPVGVYLYALSTPLNYGRSTPTRLPTSGGLNRLAPNTTTVQSWAYDPSLAVNGTTVYTGWLESSSPFDQSNCGIGQHTYIQSSPNSGTWTLLPSASACTAMDPEPTGLAGYTIGSHLKLAFINSTLYAAQEKSSQSVLRSAAWVKTWTGSTYANAGRLGTANTSGTAVTATSGDFNGLPTASGGTIIINGTQYTVSSITDSTHLTLSSSAGIQTGISWSTGQVGCFNARCSNVLTQYPVSLIAAGTTPTIALIENAHSPVSGIPEYYVYVAQFDGARWNDLGGVKLNINGSGTKALSASIASDGTANGLAACWSEEVLSARITTSVTGQIQCKTWNGTTWTRWGSSSLNQSTSAWAHDPVLTYKGGLYYLAWTERASNGVNKLYVCEWNGTSCSLLGGGTLNINTSTGWADHPSITTDGTDIYVAWEEQSSLGQHSLGHVKKWNGSSWSTIGGAIAADTINGSIEGIELSLVSGSPTVIFSEMQYGSMRQAYVKQWNGASWGELGAPIASGGFTSLMFGLVKLIGKALLIN
ncbi:MAG: hypothetical protein V4473_02250 [Patescibacteria group bacterium]